MTCIRNETNIRHGLREIADQFEKYFNRKKYLHKYTEEGIDSLLFVSDNDIRFIINNLECIYYTYNELMSNIQYENFEERGNQFKKIVLKYARKNF